MSRSDQISNLIRHFPALKPKAIERLLAARGVQVDANLIGVARLRLRRRQRVDGIICNVLNELLAVHPECLSIVRSAITEVGVRLVEIIETDPEMSDAEMAKRLAKEFCHGKPRGTLAARQSRILLRVLEEHPQYRRSMAIVLGLNEVESVISIPTIEGSDRVTDEQIERGVLQYLEKNFPSGPTVEDIARAYYDAVQLRESSKADSRRRVEREIEIRAARILSVVTDSLRKMNRLHSEIADSSASLAVIQAFVAEFADWPDSDIAERVVEGLLHQLNVSVQEPVSPEGLTIKPSARKP